MVGNMRKRKKGKKKRQEKAEAFAMAMKNVLKQPEKNAQRGPGEKGWACYYCGILTVTPSWWRNYYHPPAFTDEGAVAQHC